MGDLPHEVNAKIENMLAGGKRKAKHVSKKSSKKASKKSSKKTSKKQKGGLNPGMAAAIELRAFIAQQTGLKQGKPMFILVAYLAKKAKEKDPNMDYVKAIAEAKKIFLADKQAVIKKYKEIAEGKQPSRSKGSKKHSKKASKKHSKKASVGGAKKAKRTSKKSSKKHSKKASKKTSKKHSKRHSKK